MNYFENDNKEDLYEYLGKVCSLSVKDAQAKNYALALNKSQNRYVLVKPTNHLRNKTREAQNA